jgi:hypothetical protein
MINKQKLALWDRFCSEYGIGDAGVPLFDCDCDGRVACAPFGKDGRPILRRSAEMEALIVREVREILGTDTRNEGLLYMMHWRE